MKILYLGNSKASSTSFHMSAALKRLGHEVVIQDPYSYLSPALRNKYKNYFHYHTGYKYLQTSINKWMNELIINIEDIDIIWVNSGELMGYSAINKIKYLNIPLVLYINDDPTGTRDGNRFDSLMTAIPLFDLIITRRQETKTELALISNGKVLMKWLGYDEIFHNPKLNSDIDECYISDICFIGTWMRGENRDLFLLILIEKGLKLSIWGDRWKKSAHWGQLKNYWKGGSLSGDSYIKAIQGAKICLGMLSKGNRDLHTRRSMEIPYAGGLLCAERTTEHLQLYKENEEAIFWDDANECAEKCINLLKSPEKREAIRLAGMKRVLANKVGNEDICRQILLEVSHL